MTAEEYNAQEITAGRLKIHHLAVFVDEDTIRAFQKASGLKQDAKIGEKTRAAIDAVLGTADFGKIYEPIEGGVWWSRNEFDDDHPARDGFDGEKGDHGWPDSTGAVVIAPMDGEVIKRGWQENGLWYRLAHANGYETLSGHLNEKLVEVGQEVAAGTPLSSLWGGVHPPHIHHGVWDGERWIDPVGFYRNAEVFTG